MTKQEIRIFENEDPVGINWDKVYTAFVIALSVFAILYASCSAAITHFENRKVESKPEIVMYVEDD